LERPPAIKVKVSGVLTPGTWSTIHAVTFASRMPSGAFDTETDANR